MAQPSKNKNGTWTLTVQFEGRRCKFTIGKVTRLQANYFSNKIDLMVDHRKNGGAMLPAELQAWVEGIHRRHREQLCGLGVFDELDANITVKDLARLFLKHYESRNDVEQSTKRKTRSTLENRLFRLEKYKLVDLEPKQKSSRRNAEPVLSDSARKVLTDFNCWQRNHYACATWSRDNKLLRSIGAFAVKHGLCDYNPFSTLPSETEVNQERNRTISIDAVLDAMGSCLDPDTELGLALARFSAFRTPSEVRTLKWQHVDFDNGRLEILDSKKKKPRFMPLFDRVRDALQRQLEFTGGERFVASKSFRSKSDSDNFIRVAEAVRRSGQELWPRLRQNLRSSCENDLLELFPERLATQSALVVITTRNKETRRLQQRLNQPAKTD